MWDKIKEKFLGIKEKWLTLPFFAKALTFVIPFALLGAIWPQLGGIITVVIIASMSIAVYKILYEKK